MDMVALITLSLKYANKNNRILVIDTRKSLHFRDGFFKYFTATNNHTYLGDIDALYAAEKLDYAIFDPFIDHTTIINMNIDYPERVHMVGFNNLFIDKKKNSIIPTEWWSDQQGYRDIVYFFSNFTLQSIVTDIFKQRFVSLPKDYTAVHVRNTDYKSNVHKFLQEHQSDLYASNIFLATDDLNTVTLFKKSFQHVFNFTKIKISSDRYYNRLHSGIHFIKREEAEHEIFNIDTIVDFLLLAAAKDYIFSCPRSGFSRSVKVLFDEKITISRIISMAI